MRDTPEDCTAPPRPWWLRPRQRWDLMATSTSHRSRSGDIVRIIAPATDPVPCTNVQNDVIDGPDGRKNSGSGWIGHDLFGGDGFSPREMRDADPVSAANNFVTCAAQEYFGVISRSITAMKEGDQKLHRTSMA